MELTPEQQQIKELNLVLYQQAKEISAKEQKIKELEEKLKRLMAVITGDLSLEVLQEAERLIKDRNNNKGLGWKKPDNEYGF